MTKTRRAGKGLPAGLALSLLAATAASAADHAWAGSYVYEHDGGRTAGNSAILVTYRLDLAPERGTRACLLRIEGFQADQTIVCTLKTAGDAVSVDFHTYGDGRTVNAYGVRPYDVGAPLFALRRTGGGPLLTEWLSLSPDGGGQAPRPGSYFARRG